MKIYIDHFPDQDNFASKLANRIRSLSSNIEVTAFFEIRNESKVEDRKDLELIQKSDIIIPIITSDYLTDSVTNAEDALYEILDKNDKRIFPFIYSEANWASVNWIVKSKVFPVSGEIYTELDDNRKVQVVNEFIKTISNIISDQSTFNKSKPRLSENPKNIKNQIFISHSHSDADFAELLKLHLEKQGINCWMDSERLKIGQDWREEIDLGISASKAVIAIMSPEARKSEYVTYEWAYAWGKGIKIFPIMLSQTSLHPRLESLQYLDFTNRVTRPYDELVKRINEIKN